MEKLHINNLLQQKTSYTEGKVLEKLETDKIKIFLVDGRDKRPVRDTQSILNVENNFCPYCHQSIPCAHLGDIADWHITENKYPGTNMEVIAVSKDHSPNLKNTDFRAWMHIAQTTKSTLIYSPARKSLPEHKHIQLLNHEQIPFLGEKIEWIDENIGYTSEYKHRALIIKGDFEGRLNKTVTVLQNLYLKEHMYNLVMTPNSTYILPSKKIGRMLDARVFVGIISTTDKNIFDDIKKKIEKGEESTIITDFSDCNYEEKELRELAKKTPERFPNVSDIKNKLDLLKSKPGAILSFGEKNIPYSLEIANNLDIEFQSCNFAFVTDKKSNFYPDCIPPTFNNLINKDLLIKLDTLTPNIENYVINLMEYYHKDYVYVISNVDNQSCGLEKIYKSEVNKSISTQRLRLENIENTQEINPYVQKQIQEIKEKCKTSKQFIELVIGVNVHNVKNIAFLQEEFASATTKILPKIDLNTNWQDIDKYISKNIQPTLRDFNPTTPILLGYVAENYKDIILSQPIQNSEEGIIVLYAGQNESPSGNEATQNWINLITTETNKKIEIIYDNPTDKKFSIVKDTISKHFKNLKPGSEVIILDKYVIKKINPNEFEAYMLLRKYTDRLHKDNITIIAPELIDYDTKTKQALLTKIGTFKQYSPSEYFGQTQLYNLNYYNTFYEVLEIIRKNIPNKEIFDQTDHDLSVEGRFSRVIETINNDLTSSESLEDVMISNKVKDMIISSQDIITELPLHASHRDPNPNNYLMKISEENISVKLVDWEKFGLSRRGYEEGMFMSLLALDKDKQNEYLQFVMGKLNNKEIVMFWRTTAARALHEMFSTLHGLYDSRIQSTTKNLVETKEQKDKLILGFKLLTKKALEEINKIKKNEL